MDGSPPPPWWHGRAETPLPPAAQALSKAIPIQIRIGEQAEVSWRSVPLSGLEPPLPEALRTSKGALPRGVHRWRGRCPEPGGSSASAASSMPHSPGEPKRQRITLRDVIMEVMRSTTIEKFLMALKPLVRRVAGSGDMLQRRKKICNGPVVLNRWRF